MGPKRAELYESGKLTLDQMVTPDKQFVRTLEDLGVKKADSNTLPQLLPTVSTPEGTQVFAMQKTARDKYFTEYQTKFEQTLNAEIAKLGGKPVKASDVVEFDANGLPVNKKTTKDPVVLKALSHWQVQDFSFVGSDTNLQIGMLPASSGTTKLTQSQLAQQVTSMQNLFGTVNTKSDADYLIQAKAMGGDDRFALELKANDLIWEAAKQKFNGIGTPPVFTMDIKDRYFYRNKGNCHEWNKYSKQSRIGVSPDTIKSTNATSTLSHEFGHAIHCILEQYGSAAETKQFEKTVLLNNNVIGEKKYKGCAVKTPRPYAGYTQGSEMISVFFEFYTQDADTLAKEYPDYYNACAKYINHLFSGMIK